MRPSTETAHEKSGDEYTKIMLNRLCFLLGLLPLALTSLLSQAFAPIEGLCPLDIFHVTAEPSPESLLLWRCGSAVVGIVFLVLGVSIRPFGVVFLAVEILSVVGFLYRLLDAMCW
jgi:hypothetical protein